MKQNYMNPELEEFANLDQIKRRIEYQNYKYNQDRLLQRSENQKHYKKKQQQESSLINQKVMNELQNQKIRQIARKYQVRNILQRQYDQQIYSQKRIKTQQKSVDRLYSDMERQMMDTYEKSRIKKLTQIYNVGNKNKNNNMPYLNPTKLPTQESIDSIDQLKQMSLIQNFGHQSRKKQLYHQFQSVQQKNSFKNSDLQRPYSPQNTYPQKERQDKYSAEHTYLQNKGQKKYSASNLQYSDYLKGQIQRKQRLKDLQRQKQKQKDRSFIQRHNQAYYNAIQDMKYKNYKKKWDFAIGLENQIKSKQLYTKL